MQPAPHKKAPFRPEEGLKFFLPCKGRNQQGTYPSCLASHSSSHLIV